MDWNKIKLVSLDVDGTVYSMPQMKWHFSCLLLQRLPFAPIKVLQDINRIRQFHTKMAWLRKNENPFQAKDYTYLQDIELELLADWYAKAIIKSGVRSGLLTFLAAMKKKGIPVIACSDFQCGYKLRAMNLESYFEKYYEGSLSGELKPLNSIIETIKKDYSVTSDEILHIGDHVVRDGNWGKLKLCQTHIIKNGFEELLAHSFFKQLEQKP